VATNFDVTQGLARLDMMERIRAFEESARYAAVEKELVLGAIHLSIGQDCAKTTTSLRPIAATAIRWPKAQMRRP